MSDFVIMTDSTTDLTKDFYDKTGVLHVPHGFVLDGVERKDVFWTNMSEKDFFDALKNCSSVSTTQPEMAIIAEYTENAFREGKDAIYICFSSQLSGTYNTVGMIGAELMEKYEGRRMYVIDTKCASRGQGILVEMAVKMRDEGRTMDEIISVLETERDKIYHFFTVDDLMHLKRGGRLSGTSAVMGTIIGIKPVLHMTDDGKLEAIGKVRGRHAALDRIISMALDKLDESSETVYICHCNSEADALYVSEKLTEGGAKETYVYCLGPDISAHVGVGTVGILFHSEK